MKLLWKSTLRIHTGSTFEEVYSQYRLPFDPSDFVHFRHRLGKEGMEKIFKQSINFFGEDKILKEIKEVWVDTTVQEKTSPSLLIIDRMKRSLITASECIMPKGSN